MEQGGREEGKEAETAARAVEQMPSYEAAHHHLKGAAHTKITASNLVSVCMCERTVNTSK